MAKNDYRTIYSSKLAYCYFVPFLRHPIFFDVYLLIRQSKGDFPRLRYIVVMHNKRTCNDVDLCMFLNFIVFLQDFRGAIAESLKIATVSATFIPFIMYSNCNSLAQGGDLSNYSLFVCQL